VGDTDAAEDPVARFGTGPTALVVLRSAHAAELELAAEAEGAARVTARQQAAATALVARQAFGGSLAGNPRLEGPDEVLTALRDGSVDDRVLGALAALTADHDLSLAAGPGWTAPDAAQELRHDIGITSFDDRPTRSPLVAAELRDRLADLPPDYAPAGIVEEEDCLVLTWAPAVEEPANTESPASAQE
jgi:putative peptide zinc metalloprotease protein